jgi:hypothetical protein
VGPSQNIRGRVCGSKIPPSLQEWRLKNIPTGGLCTLKSNEETSNYAGLAQENGFASA